MKEKEHNVYIKKGDIVILLAALLFLVFLLFFMKTPAGDSVDVFVEGKLVYHFSLFEDRTIDIPVDDWHNTIEIEDGIVKMVDADCPDGLCTHMPGVGKEGGSIICLPHRIVVKVVSSDFDTISY